jgi:hypothetical protein
MFILTTSEFFFAQSFLLPKIPADSISELLGEETTIEWALLPKLPNFFVFPGL